MIKHIVCFKLNNAEKADEAKKVLLGMKGNVPEIVEMEVGTDFLHSARSYDVFLAVTVKDRASLEEYQNDPYHVGVVKKYMHAETNSSVAVDFEIEK